MEIVQDVSLKTKSTMKVGGSAKFYVEIDSKSDLTNSVEFAKSKKIPVFVLGGGSNVVFDDATINALVIHLKNKHIAIENRTVLAGAGVHWDDLVKLSVQNNLQGIECMSYIPGTVGAAPIQNIGAYGQELSDVFVSLDAYDIKRSKFVTFSKSDCKFGYRESVFKRNKGNFIIYSVTLKLKNDISSRLEYKSLTDYFDERKIKSPTLRQARNAVIKIRKQKHLDPDKYPSCGSFFINPIIKRDQLKKLLSAFPKIPYHEVDKEKVKLYAGWLIEQCGWKGKKIGSVGVSNRHALVIINYNTESTSNDVKNLVSKIQNDVQDKFGVKLVPEPTYVN